MTTTASGRGIGSSSRPAVAAALSQAKHGLGGKTPTFGFLFVSPEHDLKAALDEARSQMPKTDFVACTTAGEITEAGLTHGGVATLLVADDVGSHVVRYSSKANVPEHAADEVAGTLFAPRPGERAGVATTVLLTDGLAGSGEALVDALRAKAGRALHEIVGGAAGDEGKFRATHVGANGESGTSACAAIHVFGESRWGVGVDHGLTPATKPMRVTRAEGSVVHEIDGRRAFDVYKEYAKSRGVSLDQDNASEFLLNNELGVLIFDQLKKARAPLGVNPDGSLPCAAAVPTGASVCILDGNRRDLVEAARRAATEARDRLGAKRAAGILLFDCICRGAILGPEFSGEIGAVREVFPGVPIAGFLTYGEIARYSGKLDGWHNTTAVVVAIPA
jgi:hypothetical protein